MKKKNQAANFLDDLRHEDPKRRLNSVQSLRQIATALGPARTRTQLVQYLAEFVDDEQNIVLQLLNQLADFTQTLGGQEHEKALLPLLIGFCKTDQKKQAEKASDILIVILTKNKDLIVDVIKKLSKIDMSVAKEVSAKLICSLVGLIPQNETLLLEIYASTVFSDVSAYKIIGAKYLSKLLGNVKNKQEIGKLLEVLYNDADDLPKIFALEALINYYLTNSNTVLTKFKGLFALNNWRINVKICEIIPLALKLVSKAHFKSMFEANLLKLLDSQESQLRAKSCSILKILASTMSEEETCRLLMPLIKKLSNDPVDYVRKQISENIVGLIEVCSAVVINDQILPIIFNFIRINDLSAGIIKNFELMTKKLSNEVIQQKILSPLANQFNTDNWKYKCRMIQLLNNVINNPVFLNDKIATLISTLLCDKINSVRQKAAELVIVIINQQLPQWFDSLMMSKLYPLRQSQNYVQRQVLLQIIEKTSDRVTEKTLNEFYRSFLIESMNDKVPNVRAKALKTLKCSKKLYEKAFDKYLQKLKNDSDGEVKELAQQILKS